MEQIDRRRFLQRAGIGAGAAGALWVAPSVLGYDAAFAGASCQQRDAITWSSYTGVPPAAFGFAMAGTHPALTVTRTYTAPGGGVTPDTNNGKVNVQTLTIPPDTAGSTIGGQSSWFNMQFQTTTANRGYDLTFGFSVAVFNLQFTLLDIDATTGQGAYNDALWVTTIGTGPPFAFTCASNEVSNTTGVSQATAWTGSALVDNTQSSNGNVSVTVPGPVTSVTIHYRGTMVSTSKQVVGISNLTWCR